MLPNLGHTMKLLRVHDPEKELDRARRNIERLEKTVIGLRGINTRMENEVNRLRLEVAKLKDMLKR